MCPFCFASVGLVFAGAVSTGGLAALAVKVSRSKNRAKEIVQNSEQRRDHDVDQRTESENRIAR